VRQYLRTRWKITTGIVRSKKRLMLKIKKGRKPYKLAF
jgi:hypothetical protein